MPIRRHIALLRLEQRDLAASLKSLLPARWLSKSPIEIPYRNLPTGSYEEASDTRHQSASLRFLNYAQCLCPSAGTLPARSSRDSSWGRSSRTRLRDEKRPSLLQG